MRKFTNEHRKNLSISLLGRKAWNKDLKMNPIYYANYCKAKKKFRGKKLSFAHRIKISRALKGKNVWSKGKKLFTSWLIGKKQSKETCLKRRISMLKVAKRKEEHPNWQGGKSYEPYPLEWVNELRESIRKRDHYKCKLCLVPQQECKRKLSIHHIDYNKNNLNKDNLISLCQDCHGRVNYRREDWQNFLSILAIINFEKENNIIKTYLNKEVLDERI